MDKLDQVSTNLTNLLASHVFPGQLYAAKFTAVDGMYRGQNYSAAELGLQLAAAAGMPTRRENGIYSAELGLRVGSELGLK